MHSGYEIPGIQHQQSSAGENTRTRDPVLLSMNHTHILDQIHSNNNTLPAAPTQQLFLDHHHFLPPHHYAAAAGGGVASPAYFPVNFKLGLNEICSRNHDYRDASNVSTNSIISINERAATDGGDLLRGSEQYELPEATRHPSLGILHCWQNQQDSPIKQPRFWEPVAAEASNENSEIVEREQQQQQQHIETLHQKNSNKSRVQFNELEAIYNKPLVCTNNDTNQTGPSHHIHPPVNPRASDQEQEDEQTSESCKNDAGKKRKKKKKKNETSYICNELVEPMSEFLESFTKQVMDHQESLHRKFSEVIERLDDERRAREEAWRNQELAHFEEECAARARDRASARSREAVIVSYLEKITGHKIDFDFQRNSKDDEGVN